MKKRIFQVLAVLVLIGISIVYLNAVMINNNPYSPFPAKTSVQAGDLITESASELLQSASEAFLFLNEVEIAGKKGLNGNAALQRVDLAAAKVEHALNKFKGIIAVGKESGYDQGGIGKLKAFNYGQYASENGLSRETMTKVAGYLGKGNVLGFYRCHTGNLATLLNILNRIKNDLNAGKLSENKLLWSLLQQYDSTMMFGNYASLVFYNI